MYVNAHGLFMVKNTKEFFYVNVNIIFILILTVYTHTNNQKLLFDTVVTFGDSNTDTGNVYKLTNYQWPLVPPYYRGRFTNGPVWIDKLNISNIMNYAYGDATIDNDNLIVGFTGPNRTLVPGIRQQIVTYLTTNDISTIDLSRTLYIIWANGNEYHINPNLKSDIVVTTLLTTVNDLLVVGIQHLIIMNLPPLQLFPGIHNDQRLNALVTEHNNYLLANITEIQLENTDISIKIFDLHTLITTILSNNSMYTLNKLDKCWNILNNNIISQCLNPNEYVFIDDNHFTTVIHQVIVDNFQQFILISSSSFRTFPCSSKFYISICIIILGHFSSSFGV